MDPVTRWLGDWLNERRAARRGRIIQGWFDRGVYERTRAPREELQEVRRLERLMGAWEYRVLKDGWRRYGHPYQDLQEGA